MRWPQWCAAGDVLAAGGPQATAVAASRSRLSGARTMLRAAARARQRGVASRCARVPSSLANDLGNLPQTFHTFLQVALWLKHTVTVHSARPLQRLRNRAHTLMSSCFTELGRRVIWCSADLGAVALSYVLFMGCAAWRTREASAERSAAPAVAYGGRTACQRRQRRLTTEHAFLQQMFPSRRPRRRAGA